MYRYYTLNTLFLFFLFSCHLPQKQSSNMQSLITPFEKDSSKTATYPEIVDFYTKLASASPFISLQESGETDAGKPLHTVVFSTEGVFTPEEARKRNKCILFINNGIHPGEPEGIDATMMLLRDLCAPRFRDMLRDIVIVVIPVYNVDGCLNRGSFSRANQNGPEAYGFRGNAQNLDLNRDFIKCSSLNALSFNRIFAVWSPDLFIDNHTSNGADYPYTMTLIPTQHNKIAPDLGAFLEGKLLPFLYKEMEKKKWEMIPYVNSDGSPDGGIYGFMDHPRYSTGYAALHHTIGFMPETHMLKPFPDRVWSTYAFMESAIGFLHLHGPELMTVRKAAIRQTMDAKELPVQWVLDENQRDSIRFKGYEAKYKKSEVSGFDRLYYDRSLPYDKEIPFWNVFKPTLNIRIPEFYILPQAYREVRERLAANGVQFITLEKDSLISVEMYYIRDFQTTSRPYEGKYLHSNVKVEPVTRQVLFHQGDLLIPTAQPLKRYIIETLEPQATDSFFAWGFFDGILQQKEHFSDYVFEDLAADLLRKHPELRTQLENAKTSDPKLAASGEAQLEWVYKHSVYYEGTHGLYPVGRGR